MAPEKEQPNVPKKNSGLNFKVVTTEFNAAGGANRDPSQLILERTGRGSTNRASTDLIFDKMEFFPGVTRDNLKFLFAADPATRNVAIYLVTEGAGAQQPRDWENVLGFHLGGLFKEYPKLKPGMKVECDLRFDYDGDGKPCFVFNINQGLAKKRKGIEGGRPKPEKKTRVRRKKKDPTATTPTTTDANKDKEKAAPGDAAAGQEENKA